MASSPPSPSSSSPTTSTTTSSPPRQLLSGAGDARTVRSLAGITRPQGATTSAAGAAPASALLARLKDFLPKMEEANRRLPPVGSESLARSTVELVRGRDDGDDDDDEDEENEETAGGPVVTMTVRLCEAEVVDAFEEAEREAASNMPASGSDSAESSTATTSKKRRGVEEVNEKGAHPHS